MRQEPLPPSEAESEHFEVVSDLTALSEPAFRFETFGIWECFRVAKNRPNRDLSSTQHHD